MNRFPIPATPFVFVFSLSFLFPAPMVGEPRIHSVQGSLMDGAVVELKGDGFGDKENARPMLWADFESSLQPSKSGERRQWDDIQNMEWSKEGPDGSGCAKATDGSGVWTLGVNHDHWSREGQKSYIFRRQRLNFTVTNINQNWKMWRLWPKGERYPNIYIGANGLVDVENVGGKGGFWGRAYVPSIDWVNEEIFFQASSMNSKDGVCWFRCNGVDISRGNVMTRSSKGPSYMSRNYVVHGVAANMGRWTPPWSRENRMWVDEVYVDTSWSRIMIGDRPLKRDSRKWEIQIPVHWTNSSILFEAHPGIFKTGETAYLFVFDADNVSNEVGIPFTVGNPVTKVARK